VYGVRGYEELVGKRMSEATRGLGGGGIRGEEVVEGLMVGGEEVMRTVVSAGISVVAMGLGGFMNRMKGGRESESRSGTTPPPVVVVVEDGGQETRGRRGSGGGGPPCSTSSSYTTTTTTTTAKVVLTPQQENGNDKV